MTTAPSAVYPRLFLAGCMSLSLVGNLAHAALTWNGEVWQWLAVGWAGIPPIAVPALLELVGREARRGGVTTAFRVGVVGAILLTVIAFTMSLWTLTALGVTMGLPTPMAAGFPLVLDIGAAVATAFLLDRATAAARSATTAATEAVAEPTTVVAEAVADHRVDNRHAVASPQAAVLPTTAATDADHRPVADPTTAEVVAGQGAVVATTASTTDFDAVVAGFDTAVADLRDDNRAATTAVAATTAADPDHRRAVAAAVVAARGLKADVEAVVAVLSALDNGLSQTAAAREAGVDRSTVRKVIDGLDGLPDKPALTLVG